MVGKAVDLVIPFAEKSEVVFFGGRDFADDFAVRKAHFLLVSLDRAKIRRQRLGDPKSGAGRRLYRSAV